MKILKPSFYDSFACSGSKCKTTCCQGWNINLTEEELESTLALSCSTLKKEDFKLLEKKEGKEEVYIMPLDEKGVCPYLKKGLCSVQIEGGYQALSNTCKVFPRLSIMYQNNLEYHLTPGCEEVVKYLLRATNGIQLMSIESSKAGTIQLSKLINQKKIDKRPVLKYYYDIKMLFLAVLQTKTYTMEKRMLILGIALQRLSKMEEENNFVEIPLFVDTFIESLESDTFKNTLNDFHCDDSFQAMNNIMTYRKTHDTGRGDVELLTRAFDRIEAKVGFSEAGGIVTSHDHKKYQEACKVFKKYMEKKEYFMENYFVNWALAGNIPFNDDLSLWETYCFFASMYSLFRFVLICAVDEHTTEDEFIKYVVALSRLLFHTVGYQKTIADEFKDSESNTLAHMAVLLLQPE